MILYIKFDNACFKNHSKKMILKQSKNIVEFSYRNASMITSARITFQFFSNFFQIYIFRSRYLFKVYFESKSVFWNSSTWISEFSSTTPIVWLLLSKTVITSSFAVHSLKILWFYWNFDFWLIYRWWCCIAQNVKWINKIIKNKMNDIICRWRWHDTI